MFSDFRRLSWTFWHTGQLLLPWCLCQSEYRTCQSTGCNPICSYHTKQDYRMICYSSATLLAVTDSQSIARSGEGGLGGTRTSICQKAHYPLHCNKVHQWKHNIIENKPEVATDGCKAHNLKKKKKTIWKHSHTHEHFLLQISFTRDFWRAICP